MNRPLFTPDLGSKLALATVSLLVAIIGCEIFVRVVYGDQMILFPRYHTDVQYGDFTMRRLRPNSMFWHTSVDGSWRFTTNNKGFRNYYNVDYENPEGKVRVIVIGDSHTQGMEVRQDYTFTAVIERYLQKNGIDAEALNAGVSGFGTAEELVFLENEAIKYRPDVVVLGFAANDFEDSINAGFFGLDDEGRLVVQKRQYIPGVRIQNFIYRFGVFRWLGENSYAYSMVFNGVWNFVKLRLARREAGQVFEFSVATQDFVSGYQFALMTAMIERMHEVCRRHGIKLIIIDILRAVDNRRIVPSVPADFESTMRNNADAYVDSREVLQEFAGVAELNTLHGHGHISEFTHTQYGIAAARQIMAMLKEAAGARSDARLSK